MQTVTPPFGLVKHDVFRLSIPAVSSDFRYRFNSVGRPEQGRAGLDRRQASIARERRAGNHRCDRRRLLPISGEVDRCAGYRRTKMDEIDGHRPLQLQKIA